MGAANTFRTPRRIIWGRGVLLVFAVIFAAGAVAQFFLAGLSVFETPLRWANHVVFGHVIGVFAALMWIPALLGLVDRRLLTATIGMAVLMVLQYAFVESGVPAAQALHPLNGAVLFALAIWIAGRAARSFRVADRGADPSVFVG